MNSGRMRTGATTESSSSTAITPAVTGSHQPCGHARSAATRPVIDERREDGADRERLRLVAEPARKGLAREPRPAGGAPARERERQAGDPQRGERGPGVHRRVDDERPRRGERIGDARAPERGQQREEPDDRLAGASAAAGGAPVRLRLGLAQRIGAAVHAPHCRCTIGVRPLSCTGRVRCTIVLGVHDR